MLSIGNRPADLAIGAAGGEALELQHQHVRRAVDAEKLRGARGHLAPRAGVAVVAAQLLWSGEGAQRTWIRVRAKARIRVGVRVRVRGRVGVEDGVRVKARSARSTLEAPRSSSARSTKPSYEVEVRSHTAQRSREHSVPPKVCISSVVCATCAPTCSSPPCGSSAASCSRCSSPIRNSCASSWRPGRKARETLRRRRARARGAIARGAFGWCTARTCDSSSQ